MRLLVVSVLVLTALRGCGGDDGKAVAFSDYRRFLVADYVLFRLCATPADLARIGSTNVIAPSGVPRLIALPHWSQAKAIREVESFGQEYADVDYRVGEGNEHHLVGPMLRDVVTSLERCRPAAAAQLQETLAISGHNG